ncbi:hypothetical protein AJ78_06882 [Emergomyces pasteurianus Ep9510]|uniref:Uncharacterized protein n=1 Tax=Emergomyces pasteurianus Ep9510 TaxID=1447872 RepID=A0A1J9P7C4_9EURO|nr:hypothetical protein AJ78_06882 [Emergomyces pasteurianus Ep9510]
MRPKDASKNAPFNSNNSHDLATYLRMAPIFRNLFFLPTASSKATGRMTSLGSPTHTDMVSESDRHHHHRRRRTSHYKEREEHKLRQGKSDRTHSTEEAPEKPARESHRTQRDSQAPKQTRSRKDGSSTVSIPVDSSSCTARSAMASGGKARESIRSVPPKRSAMQRAVAESWMRYNQPLISLPLRLGEQSDWQHARKAPKSSAPKDKSGKHSYPEKQAKRSRASKNTVVDIHTSPAVAERT